MKRMLVTFAGALFAASAVPAYAAERFKPIAPEAAGFSAERLQRLDDAIAAVVANGEVAGTNMLLIRHGKEVAFRSYGKRDLATGAPVERDTIFRIYSMTKPVTGVAMMILFEEGKWRLDDPVTRFIPEFKDLKVIKGVDAGGRPILEPAKRPPTMRELMSHQAGFAYGFDPNDPVDRMFNEANVLGSNGTQAMIDKLAKIPLMYQPGERWRYSVAVDIQGYIIEKISGRSLGRFLEERIFRPLEMVDTGFVVPRDKVNRFAAAYVTEPASRRLIDARTTGGFFAQDFTQPPPFESGGGGLVSTIDDYARFSQMLANGGALDGVRILSPATVQLMRANVVTPAAQIGPDSIFNENVGFGLDFLVIANPREAGRLEGKDTMSWEGAAGTFFWVDPTNDVVYVQMLQNFSRAAPLNSLDTIARPLVYQALVEPDK